MRSNLQGSFFDLKVRHRGSQPSIFVRSFRSFTNSDQGSHFTSPQYTQLLLSHDVRISMDSKGRALANIFTERLWRTIKYEEVYIKDYASPREAREGLRDYLRFYNEQRPHQSLADRTPAEVYFAD